MLCHLMRFVMLFVMLYVMYVIILHLENRKRAVYVYRVITRARKVKKIREKIVDTRHGRVL